jgi:hypothetical protein
LVLEIQSAVHDAFLNQHASDQPGLEDLDISKAFTSDPMQNALNAAMSVQDYQLAESIEALMKSHMNLNSSNDILDNILNNL